MNLPGSKRRLPGPSDSRRFVALQRVPTGNWTMGAPEAPEPIQQATVAARWAPIEMNRAVLEHFRSKPCSGPMEWSNEPGEMTPRLYCRGCGVQFDFRIVLTESR